MLGNVKSASKKMLNVKMIHSPACKRSFRSSSFSSLRDISCSRYSMILSYFFLAISYLPALKNTVPFSLKSLECKNYFRILFC